MNVATMTTPASHTRDGATADDVVLSAEDVSVRVQGAQTALLEPVSLALKAGEPLVVIGETGSGKSLLAQALLGTLPPELVASGSLWLDGEPYPLHTPENRRPLWGRRLAVLPQEPWLALDPLMKVIRQVGEAYRLVAGRSAQASHAAARSDLEQLGVAAASEQLPGKLSGGMAQRVAFAAARAGGAPLLIADEPTKGLDAARVSEIGELLLKSLAETPRAGLMVITHDMALAHQIGGRLMVVRRGQVIEQGATRDVLAAPTHAYTRRLVNAAPQAWPEAAFKPAADSASRDGKAAGETIIRAENLTIARGDTTLLRDVELSVKGGEIIGVQGASGCGKSSLGDALLGLLPPHSGRVVQHAERLEYQKLYQDPVATFPPRRTLGRLLKDLSARHGLDDSQLPQLMEQLSLAPELLSRLPGQVSGGELQRFALLRLMLIKPRFVFADEPTSRLDPLVQQEVIACMVKMVREQGTALVLVSHDAALLRKVADRVLVVEEGRLKARQEI
ncbi:MULTISPECIES: ABC transporter ATP-binding protein [Cobetia]|uniref:ABC transporter ATP-binding protein n=2 Tax=Halomonadaceae TaxID=28256 RepID=UPI0012AA3C89|nr:MULTISPECIES: ATP-binding cassette domain-containing protein [Cobetia]WOI24375.1 ATP-binding cassette domain-containing protein [Cobetia amphilecti]BBO56206.1 ABC transporter ATP-binding protein [Cobetia sp. AM6]|tara:strand:+ start:55385 stop:56902 length:1518 start_codon:yes stop_codon:yes gene_type:complete